MLLCDFVVPNDQHRAEFFVSLKIPKIYGKSKATDGLSWLKPKASRKHRELSAFKGTKFILLTYGQITIISIISLAMAMINIMRFHSNLKPYMEGQKPMMKLLAFKMVVGLEFLEQVRKIHNF
ncbi:uncharacterized protein N7446_011324 [Penicillium canescens]|uniref:uncharacterized protein n=1 Tax=Penicillium canescens TaxID=5083 RepID=UPI0026E0D027|nr:uncharacterized protein N7446_011324 [Penicillium canescens]KAJ6048641.1 hypothetical protein N7446_011324 [Penicillium canescens]